MEMIDSGSSSVQQASSSSNRPAQKNGQHNFASSSSHAARQELSGKLASLDAEIASVDEDINKLKAVRSTLVKERQDLLAQMQQPSTNGTFNGFTTNTNGKAGSSKPKGTDYSQDFDWSGELKARMKSVFGINDFRLCQKGVCNANMDSRDIVCVMPTGASSLLFLRWR